MTQHAQMASLGARDAAREKLHAVNWEKIGVLYARLVVGSALLSVVAGRFGLWDGTLDLKYFARFLRRCPGSNCVYNRLDGSQPGVGRYSLRNDAGNPADCGPVATMGLAG